MTVRPSSALLGGLLLLEATILASASPAWGQVGRPRSAAFQVECSPAARADFERGVTLLHHMTYPRARESFQRAAESGTSCGMAYWGVAMTLFQPLWPTRPGPAELRRGSELSRTALGRGRLTSRDTLMVRATMAFFQDPDSPDYWSRLRRWESGMAKAYAAFPRDHEVAAFYALSLLAAASPDDSSLVSRSQRATAILMAIYREDPAHPGVLHYLVHASDAPGRANAALTVVRQYEASAPQNPHALHMPTHIYTRLGDWDGVIRGNLLAAEAALASPAGDSGQYVWDEFPHAIEYLVYADLQVGEDSAAAAQLQRLHGTPHLQPTFKTAFHLASTSARYALERRAWGEARGLTPRERPELPWDRYPWPEAVTWFAKGLGAVHEGALVEAEAAGKRLDSLQAVAEGAGETVFARNIQILSLELRAWRSHAGGDTVSSRALMREAVALEAATPKHAVTPAPTLPANELLGDMLLGQRHAAAALAAYRSALQQYPRRFNALLGAARAADASGDQEVAREYYRQLLAIAGRTARPAAVAEARGYLAR